MEVIIHPTIKTKRSASYNFILRVNDKIDVYIGNEESREAEKFDYIIEICNEDCTYDTLSYPVQESLQFQFNDVRTQPILGYLEKVNEFINKTCKNEGKLLIHCGEGISRSASIFIMYLIHNYKYTYIEAYNIVFAKRAVKPNVGFVKQLKRLCCM